MFIMRQNYKVWKWQFLRRNGSAVIRKQLFAKIIEILSAEIGRQFQNVGFFRKSEWRMFCQFKSNWAAVKADWGNLKIITLRLNGSTGDDKTSETIGKQGEL